MKLFKEKNDSALDNQKAEGVDDIEKKRKRVKRKRINRVLDRIAGFIIVTVLVIGFSALGFDYLCVKGPSKSFSHLWLQTFSETRRFDFLNNIFFSQQELDGLGINDDRVEVEIMPPTMDMSLITISDNSTDINGMDSYGLIDEDGDGIITETVTFRGATGYIIVVHDPKRVFLGTANDVGNRYGSGMLLDDMVAKYNAIGGINAGVFTDDGGAGTGWPPQGITISGGDVFEEYMYGPVCGFTEEGLMYVGYYSISDCLNFGFKNACTFGPVLIANGEKMDEETLASGVNPRTAIGQRADGAVVMLAVDGRQAYSFGLTYGDCADLLLDYGCVNAINMDGGSSTCMYYEGKLVNHPSNQAGGTRYLPTAWLFK